MDHLYRQAGSVPSTFLSKRAALGLRSLHLGTWFAARVSLVLACIVLVFLSGCARQLLGALDESSANQVLSALRIEGIEADKAPSGEGQWRVNVSDAQLAQAVQVLSRHNLPPQRFDGLGEVFKKESLVSTPTEERARLIHALSQELERSLLEIDGVLVARVHPVIPPHDPLSTQRTAASASVLIKHRPGVEMAGLEGTIRSLVSAGIEGVAYDEVRVLMVPSQAYSAWPESAGVHAATAERWRYEALWLGISGFLICVSLCWREGPRVAGRLRSRWQAWRASPSTRVPGAAP